MPKERTHWRIAALVLNRLGELCFSDCSERHSFAYYFGAIAFDCPFYVSGRRRPDLNAIGDRIHGNRRAFPGVSPGAVVPGASKDGDAASPDTFEAFRRVVRRLAPGPDDPAWAFLAGAATHIAADTVFHPLVYWVAGSPDHPDKAVRDACDYRHRLFETGLDLVLGGPGSKPWEDRVDRLFESATKVCGLDRLLDILSAFWGLEEADREDALLMAAEHGKKQRLFHRRGMALLARLLFASHRRRNADLSALFYPWQRSRAADRYPRRFEYRQPVTGESRSASLDELVDAAVSVSLAFIRDLAEARLATPLEVCLPFKGRIGPNLDTGVRADRDQTMRYCGDLAKLGR